jgi:hypothetical protein
MIKKHYIYLAVFVFLLILFSIFSTKLGFHDSGEYITNAKYFAGIHNVNLFVGHSLIYPILMGLFLKIWTNVIMIKLVNCLWIFLIGVLMLFWLKNEKLFFLWTFSPLTWYVAIQTTPVLPASFFIFLAYLFYHNKNSNYHYLWSGLSLGLACAVYTPMLLVALFFVVVYFWNFEFKKTIKYSVFVFLGFIPALVLDYSLFGNPIYTLIKYAGANLIVILGLHQQNSYFQLLTSLSTLSLIIVISPFLFKIYKIDVRKYIGTIIFVILSSLAFFSGGALIKYFLIVSPILLLLLSEVLSEKDLKIHCLISIVIALILISSFFGINNETQSQKDLKKIEQDYNTKYIIGGPSESLFYSMLSWTNTPYFVWLEDYQVSVQNKTSFRDYSFTFNSKVPTKDKLEITAVFERYENKTYDNYILVTSNKNFEGLEKFKLDRCYEKLCVYKN